ncbi:MAG: ribosome biogenesis GTPase YlqF, partial [Clostridia bacterium]|nr:ribosome biogenesis GTPase YlqF [Clostridia bacterium]
MIIQWFPGHMTKAIRNMEVSLKKVDSIIYLLDSRAPYSCVNPVFEKFLENKKTVFVLNKCDLVNPRELAKWEAAFRAKGMT